MTCDELYVSEYKYLIPWMHRSKLIDYINLNQSNEHLTLMREISIDIWSFFLPRIQLNCHRSYTSFEMIFYINLMIGTYRI